MSARSPDSPTRWPLRWSRWPGRWCRWRRPSSRVAALVGTSPSPGPGFISMSPALSLMRARCAGLPRPLTENPVPARLSVFLVLSLWRRWLFFVDLRGGSTSWRHFDPVRGTPTPREGGLHVGRRPSVSPYHRISMPYRRLAFSRVCRFTLSLLASCRSARAPITHSAIPGWDHLVRPRCSWDRK